jgi:uncharacterized SAM-binding protein YcdF (DUF218 family)
MKRLRLIIYLTGALVLVFIVKNAGNFLAINQPPQKADVIIVLSGGADARAQQGIQLYRQGYAPCLLFTASPSNLPKTKAMSEGVPEQAIILDPWAQNTYQNAVNSKALMERYGFRSAIVVSSDYHMRRVSLIFARVFRGTGTVLTYVSANDPGFHPSRWWTSTQTMPHMAWEYGGMAAFYLGLGPYITGAWVNRSPFWRLFRYMH